MLLRSLVFSGFLFVRKNSFVTSVRVIFGMRNGTKLHWLVLTAEHA